MPERLLAAVNELVETVKSLERTLKHDYPRREEINRRRRSMIYFVILAIVASYFFTVGTISVCFLEKGARSLESPSICKVLPGYSASIDQNRKLIKQFNSLLRMSTKNQRRIQNLERVR